MPIILASLVINVLVAGFFGLATGFSLNSILPKIDVVFGPDTPARRLRPVARMRRKGVWWISPR
jgi:hypothetical protein